MFGISVPDAVLIIGGAATLLTAYLGTQKGGKARAEETAQAPSINQTGMALLIDGRVLDRLTIACDRIASAIEQAVKTNDEREAREVREDQQRLLAKILDEMKRLNRAK